MRCEAGHCGQPQDVNRRDLLPRSHGRVMFPKKPRNRRRATGSLENALNVPHSPALWDMPSKPVNDDEGHTPAIVCESPTSGPMVQKPRKSREGIRRSPLAQRLRDLRVAAGLTQMELAVELDISRTHVGKMETDGDPPGRETLVLLAKFFGVSVDYLLTGRAETPKIGRFVDSPDELALLDLWNAIPASERPRIIRLIRAAALD
jgi:transcriptional regulator with XRE-family HTH domain